jgi:hypothetical protein
LINLKKYIYAFLLVILFVFINDVELFARAGGSGDYNGSGSGGDEGWFLTAVFFVLNIIPHPYNIWIISILTLIFIAGWIGKKMKK